MFLPTVTSERSVGLQMDFFFTFECFPNQIFSYTITGWIKKIRHFFINSWIKKVNPLFSLYCQDKKSFGVIIGMASYSNQKRFKLP